MSFDEGGFQPSLDNHPAYSAPAPRPAAAAAPTAPIATPAPAAVQPPVSTYPQPTQAQIPPINTSAPLPQDSSAARLEEALFTDNGIDRLLNRLKQSISSTKDFSGFLRERSGLEDKHAQGYKKLVRNTTEVIRRPDSRQGTYSRRFEESLRLYERLADNGLNFANTLHSMADELRDMADNTDKGRKHWKHQSIDAEKRVQEAENAMRKAQDRLAQVSDQYERARTGEKSGGKFGLKPKSAAQQEESLRDKADQLEQDYNQKAEAAEQARYDLESSVRPQIVQNLSDLIAECDAGLAMQMAKLASLSEKHAVTNGMTISPMKLPNSGPGPEPRGLRQIAMDIDNRKDFHEYVLGHEDTPAQFSPKSRRNTGSLSQFHSRDPSIQAPSIANNGAPPPQLPHMDNFNSSFDTPRPEMANRNSYMGGAVPVAAPAPTAAPAPVPTAAAPVVAEAAATAPVAAGRGQPPTAGAGRGQTTAATGVPSVAPAAAVAGRGQPPASVEGVPPVAGRGGPVPPPNGRGGPAPGPGAGPGRGAAVAGRGGPPTGRGGPTAARGGPVAGRGAPAGRGRAAPPGAGRGAAPPPYTQPAQPALPPLKPVFGKDLNELFQRDNSAVPLIVFECIRAIDQFGIDTEGIYRVPGSVAVVSRLKAEFDHDPEKVDLGNPTAFSNDIAAVATLLKNFLRDLPDPLLTRAAYQSFIQASKLDDDVNRRDSLHQYINSLPDPNYATLRVLTMHLHRVAQHSSTNKMTINNLATVFGPTVTGGDVTDTGSQNRTVETILQNTYEIFDPDEDE